MSTIKVFTQIHDNRLLDGLLSAMHVMQQIEKSSDETTLDFRTVGFVTPIFALPLVVFINSLKHKPNIKNLSEYLQTVRFADGLQPDEMRRSEFIAVMERYAHKTYIPIINFPADKESDDKKDAILTTVENIIIRQLGISPNVASGLKYMIGEYVDNIIQHSNSKRGFIFAQSYPQKGFLDICIADNGMTLLGSYMTLEGNEIESDLEAMQAANRGISTKNLPDAENRGYGIITSKRMLAEGLGGTLVMISGNAMHIYSESVIKYAELPKQLRWSGTIIALRIPYVNRNFSYINYIE